LRGGELVGLRDGAKRDSSAPQPGNFAGAKLKKKRRAALVGMTVLGGWIEIAKISLESWKLGVGFKK
jgi:hypothetical protein